MPPGPLPKKLALGGKGEDVSLQEHRWDVFNLKIMINSGVRVDKEEEGSGDERMGTQFGGWENVF